jgi:hypothetical protein
LDVFASASDESATSKASKQQQTQPVAMLGLVREFVVF